MASRGTPEQDRQGGELYALLEELNRLEDLLEEMTELGVESRDEAERRLADLNARVDHFSGE